MKNTLIKGLGFSVPNNLLTNADLEKLVDTNDEWITSRTGIKQRYIVGENEPLSDFAVVAARQALDEAGMKPEELTHILLATFSADAYIPCSAAIVQHKLGIKGRMAMDLSAACSGFLYGLETARSIIALHPQAKVLVCAGDITTSRVNWKDRATCILFGDGCGAAVVTADDGGKRVASIKDVILASDGGLGDLLTIRGGGSGTVYRAGDTIREDFFVQMEGREIFKHAVRKMCEISRSLLEKHGLALDDVDVILPHQANLRIIDAINKKLDFPREKTFVNVDRYGNTSAASVPIALTEAWRTNFVNKGERMLICTFGGGFTWGAGILEF